MSNVHNHPADKSAKPAKVKNLKPNPQPKAKRLTLPKRDPRRRSG